MQPDEAAIGRSWRGEPEQGTVERVDPGARHPDPAEAEVKTGFSRVARVVERATVGGQDGEVGLAPEPIVEGRQEVLGSLGRVPCVLEPAGTDLGVGPAVDPALRPVRRCEAPGSRAGRRCG